MEPVVCSGSSAEMADAYSVDELAELVASGSVGMIVVV